MTQENPPSELDARPQSRREWHGWLRSVVLPLGLVVLIVAGLLYFQSNRGGGAKDDGFGVVELPAAKNGTPKAKAAEEVRAAPDFLLRSMDGDPVRLSDMQGHPLVVNFFASWCAPCRTETPDLIDLYEQHQSEGLELLAVNLREAEQPVSSFADEFGVPYPVLLDRDGQVARTWRIGGPNSGIPSTYFIDEQGVVRKVVFGNLTDKLRDEGLALILGGS
jgi:peroxiredoxin